jgi:metal-responsive CopG/Arc/MetJ family transcriptional regulator
MKAERISYHVPGDLVPIIKELAERDGTPPSKWLGEIIRAYVREQRQKLVNHPSQRSVTATYINLNSLEALSND